MALPPIANRLSQEPSFFDKMEGLLEESRLCFRAIFENAFDGILLIDSAGRCVDGNPAICFLLGYSREELLQLTVSDVTPNQDRASILDILASFLFAGTTIGVYTLLCKGGATRNVEYRAFANIVPGLHLGILRDITERMRVEEVLRASEERLRAIVDTAMDAIITFDERGVIDSVNPATERMFGYSGAEMIGREIKMLMTSAFHEDGYLEGYLMTGGARLFIGINREVEGLRKDGSIFPVDLSVSEFMDKGRHMFSGIYRDISARKQLERRVLEVATEEQRRIGQELHDTIGQELTALTILAETMAEAVKTRPPPAELTIAPKIVEGVKRTWDQLRAIARGLIPVGVDARGLEAALAEFASQVSKLEGVTCTLDLGNEPVRIEEKKIATHLLRIAQEAVTNAVRHGKASIITLRLEEDEQTITLRIQDNGIEFREQLLENEGMGLKIMRDRAGLIHARISVGPADPTGNAVTCTLHKGTFHD